MKINRSSWHYKFNTKVFNWRNDMWFWEEDHNTKFTYVAATVLRMLALVACIMFVVGFSIAAYFHPEILGILGPILFFLVYASVIDLYHFLNNKSTKVEYE